MTNASQFSTWEAAVAWLLDQPERRALVRACYYDRPPLDAAKRYWADPEWQTLRQLLPARRGKALDVGAGMGIASYALARDGWATTALEPDPSALVGAHAIRSLAQLAAIEIEVVQEWGEGLPFPDASFDLVHARQVLHHARDLERFCAELHRVLKPGGMLAATREHVISSAAQPPAFLQRHELHRLYGGENAFTLARYRSALRAGGFEIEASPGPWESVINYAPLTEDSLCNELISRAARVPGGASAARALLSRPLRPTTLRALSAIDRRPGRLHSFLCRKRAL